MERLSIDLIPGGYKPACHASQYDVGRVIRFDLLNNKVPYTLTGAESITIEITKPDGTKRTEYIANTQSSYVDFTTGDGTCDVAGDYSCELVITNNGNIIGSGNFTMAVEIDAYGDVIITVQTASGRIATFETNIADVLQEVKCEITAKQDLHGEDKPYPAGGGVNLWDGVAESGYIYNGTEYPSASYWRTKNYIPIAPNTEYYFRASANDGQINWYDINKTFISAEGSMGGADRVATSPENAYFVRFYQPNSSDASDTGVNYPSTDTSYHPYANICPIVGHSELNLTRCGVNLWDEQWETGGFNADGTTNIRNDVFRTKNYIQVPPNTVLHIHQGNLSDSDWCYPVFYDINKTPITRGVGYGTITMPSNAYYLRVQFNTAMGNTYANNISINYPATDTVYHAYNGTPFTVAFGQTVYGGVYDKSGRLTITYGYKTYDGSNDEDWGFVDGVNRAYISVSDIDISTPDTDIADVKANIYVSGAYSGNGNRITGRYNIAQINIFDSSVNNISEWRALLSNTPMTVAYELATPIVIDVPSISVSAEKGMNNVWHDGNGNTEVKYLVKG